AAVGDGVRLLVEHEERADTAEDEHAQDDGDEQPLLASRLGNVCDDGVARETEVPARLDEAQANVAEIDGVAAAQLDLAVVLAVDANAVGRLQIADRVAAGLGI